MTYDSIIIVSQACSSESVLTQSECASHFSFYVNHSRRKSLFFNAGKL